jgi:Leucine-rich repeat (LRR) protein
MINIKTDLKHIESLNFSFNQISSINIEKEIAHLQSINISFNKFPKLKE